MSCVPIKGRPWYCDTHWPLPLYPDGKCNRGREEERVSQNTIHEIPTPVSAFRPSGILPIGVLAVEPDPFPSEHDYDACRDYTEAEKDRAYNEGFEAAVRSLASETPRVDNEVVSNALAAFELADERRRPALWQVVRNLIEAGGRRAESLTKGE